MDDRRECPVEGPVDLAHQPLCHSTATSSNFARGPPPPPPEAVPGLWEETARLSGARGGTGRGESGSQGQHVSRLARHPPAAVNSAVPPPRRAVFFPPLTTTTTTPSQSSRSAPPGRLPLPASQAPGGGPVAAGPGELRAAPPAGGDLELCLRRVCGGSGASSPSWPSRTTTGAGTGRTRRRRRRRRPPARPAGSGSPG